MISRQKLNYHLQCLHQKLKRVWVCSIRLHHVQVCFERGKKIIFLYNCWFLIKFIFEFSQFNFFNLLGLRLDVDPDIVAAMDDDFDFDDPENQLEDDFIELANADRSDDSQWFVVFNRLENILGIISFFIASIAMLYLSHIPY